MKYPTLTRLASVLTYPLRPSDYLTLVDPRHSHRQLRAVVTSVTSETQDAATIVFRPGPNWRPHRAGEWVRVGVQVDGVQHWRPFSLSSAEGEEPAITVSAVGRVTRALVHDTRPGDVLFLDQPRGDFLLPAQPGPLLFVTAGSGISPAMGMIRTMLHRRPDADIVLVHSARTPERAIFASELGRLNDGHPGLRVLPWFSSERGRLDLARAGALDELVPDWRRRAAYVCGPPAMNTSAEGLWASEQLRPPMIERFTIVRHAGPPGQGGRVTFARSARTVDASGASSILDAGEDAGVALASGCRMGICRTCVCRLDSGQVRDLATGAVHGEPGDYIRICVSAAAGDVRLEA